MGKILEYYNLTKEQVLESLIFQKSIALTCDQLVNENFIGYSSSFLNNEGIEKFVYFNMPNNGKRIEYQIPAQEIITYINDPTETNETIVKSYYFKTL